MPENVIQPADRFIADTFFDGKLTPQITQGINTDKFKYDQALTTMYTQKYNSSYSDFDQFKAAYQSQYGDPFKKKEPTVSSQKKVTNFQVPSARTETTLNEAVQEANIPTQELPSENYVTPSGETQASTFQPAGSRQQIPLEEALETLSISSKQQEADALRLDMYSKGLLQNTGLTTNLPDKTATRPDYSVASESTGVNKLTETLEDKGRGQAQYDALQNAIDYGKITGRQIADIVPGFIDARNRFINYIYEKSTGNPGLYTKEERDAAYNSGDLAYKVFAHLSGDRLTSSYDEFSDNYLKGSEYAEQSEAGAYAAAAGQLASMFVGGSLFKAGTTGAQVALDAGRYAGALGKVQLAVDATGKIITSTIKSPSTYIAGQQIFNNTFQEAYQATGDSDKAMAAAAINTVISSGLEVLPILNFTSRVDKLTGGAVKKSLVNGVVGGVEEAITEGLQGVVENAVAANIYDETRQLTDGLSQQIEVGGVTGFAMNVVLTALHVKLRNTTDPYERQEIEKAIQDTTVKQQAVQKQEAILENALENAAVVKTNEKVQDVLATPNISTEQIIEANQIRKTMPNEEAVGYKTVGMTNRINELMVEKNALYDKVVGGENVVEQTKIADARSFAIDQEIRKLSNDIAEVYAAPSKQVIDQATKQEDASKIRKQVSGEERIGQESEQAQPIQEPSGEATEANRVLQTQEQVAPIEEEDLTDPDVVAQKYHEERVNPVNITPSERAIADLLASGISKEGVQRQGDINKFSNSMARSYFKEGGQTIDQIAQQASSTINPEGDGNEVTPEDVWDFMNKYPQGPDQIDRPAGNPRLKQLSEKYVELTGKQLNKTVAKKIAEAKSKPVENIKEDPNSVIEKYTDEDGNLKLDELESDISALPFLYDLTPEETQIVSDYVKESRKANRASGESTGAAPVEQPEGKVTYADKTETIREIKEKKLTHIQGVAMGSGVAKGTYLSTEKGNRYKGRGKKFTADISIENPYTTSENNLNKERGDILKSNIDKFTEIDFEGAEIPNNPTIDDLSNSGTEKLADLFTKNLQEQGYDSMYFPESKTQEGELVVFDKSKVTLTEDAEITDAMKMSREAYNQKYPEGNYDEARAEYTKNTENLMDANKKGETLEGVILMQRGLLKAIPMDTRFKKGSDKLKQAWIKATRFGGAIPENLVFDYSYIRKNTIAQKIEEVELLARQIRKSNEKILGGKVTNQQLVAMDQLLHGETPDIALPSEVIGNISTFRSVIDGLSLEMKNSGMLTDSLQAVFDINMGTHVNRSFKKWTDPVWKDNVPEEIMNKALVYLKNKYIQFYTEKYTKSQEAFKNKDKRIRDFRTSIKNKQNKLIENNNRLAEYKTKHDAYISKLDGRIKKAKKRPNKEQVGPDLSGKNKKTKKESKIEYLEAIKSEAIKDFNSIYETKKSQFDKQNAKIEAAIAKAEQAAYNLQQRNYPQAMQESLDRFTNPDDGEISAIINQILYAPTDSINPSGKAGAIQSSFLKRRSETLTNSPEIRALMGEYTDPYINFLSTTNKMITAIQNYTFQKQLKAKGMGVIFSDKPTGDYHRKIEGDAWKGLIEDGDVYTTEVFEQALKELNGMIQQDMSPGMKTFRAIVSYVKVGKTAASTPGAVANYISNISNIVSNAWNPIYAAKKITLSSKSELAEEFKELKKLGVLGQSVSGRELADRIKDTAGYVPLENYLDSLPGLDIVGKGIKATINASKKIFELGDEYARVIGFYAEVERYRTVHTDWTESQLRENAAKIVANNSPTYDLAYPWVKNFRNSPWFSTFATFPAEIYRTTINQGYQIKKDLSNPKTAAIGATRLAGVLTSMGFGAYQIMEMATTAISGDDEDERDLRLFVPEYSKSNPLLFYRKEGEEYTYTDAGRFTYYNNFVSPIIAFSNGNIEKDEFDNRIYNAIGQMLQPFTDINIVTEAGADIAFGYKSGTDEKIYSENDSNIEKLLKTSEHISGKLEPTNIKVARSFYDLAVYGKTKYGSEVTLETAALSSFGVKSRVLNVTNQFTYEYYKQKAQGDNDKIAFERAYKNARSEEEKAKALEIYKTQIINQINKMSYLYHAALRLGSKSDDLNKKIAKLPTRIKTAVKSNDKKFNVDKAADLIIKEYIDEL